ncbi:MAG TPA: hypothetical protein VHY35_24690 [Stellaceae bacterium]|jgi:hypothetical protein|nr:hypothetical protein [Stellaceae bacterium]
MPVIDLTRYIVASTGTWTDPSQDKNLFDFTIADTVSPDRLMLRWAGDFVALTGPLSIRVTVQAENMTVPLALVGNLVPDAVAAHIPAGAAPGQALLGRNAALSEAAVARIGTGRGLSLQASTIYEYTLDIAAGQAWPFSLSEQLDALRFRGVQASRQEQLGNNLGYRVVIEPAFAVAKLIPVTSGNDLPCDFAVAHQPNTASFFPVACEPCEGSVIGLPPNGAVTLVTPPAEGGCVRTRFFNGMFITREDLETEQRYHRVKSRLHNRAAGAGVVWGLNVGRHGSAVCVTPGYGVDCCGNDLALTSLYKVEIAALLADPAAARYAHQRGPHGMHLLLEYIECPSDPRPVHGDACTPQSNRCEMSRIRESVRLRLIPPRDCGPESRPIGRFLAEVRELRTRYPLGNVAVVGGSAAAPFRLRIESVGDNSVTATVRPSAQLSDADQEALKTLIGTAPKSITVDIIRDPLAKFIKGTQSGQALRGEQVISGGVEPDDPVDLSHAAFNASVDTKTTFTLTDQQSRVDHLVFKVANWQAQPLLAPQDAPAPSGDLTLTIQFSDRQIKNVALAETAIEGKPLDLAAAPCVDPCGTGGFGDSGSPFDCGGFGGYEKVFGKDGAALASVLPWLHQDPARPTAAGDPKALIMAALGGWLSQMMARDRVGTSSETGSARREIAEIILRVAWLLLFGIPANADSAALGNTLKRLLEGWCEDLLWKGPECCGEPHGVVIGCAVVEGGTIQSIDPIAGRRYVVHYPLVEHWLGQFGVAPPDVTLSHLFFKICCLAALPAPGRGVADANRELPNAFVSLGDGYLAVGSPAAITAQITEHKIAVVSRRTAALPEMIASAVAAFSTAVPANRDRLQYTALVLDTIVAEGTVMLLLPA